MTSNGAVKRLFTFLPQGLQCLNWPKRFCVGWAEEILAAILLKYKARCNIIGHRHRSFVKLFSKRLTGSF